MKLAHRSYESQVDTLSGRDIASDVMNAAAALAKTTSSSAVMAPTAKIQGVERSRRQFSLLILLAGCLCCCGKPFDVKPKNSVSNTPPVNYTATAETNGLTVSAEAVTDEDYLFDTFDANLILAGVLPVQVKLSNAGAEKVELKDAKFELRAADNHTFKQMDAEKVYKRLRKYYGIIIYNKHGNSEAKTDFKSYALDSKGSIKAGEVRDGMLFFSVPTEIIHHGNLTLVARKLPHIKNGPPIELKLK